MRKWVVIFLLLANVVTFFGFTMLNNESSQSVDMEIEQAFELRLVSEVSPQSLIKISDQKASQLSSLYSSIDAKCIQYEGIKDQNEADKIVDFMLGQGLDPIILVGYSEDIRYELVLPVPLSSASEKGLVELFRKNNILLAPSNNFAEKYLTVGIYSNLAAAQKRIDDLLMVSTALEIKQTIGRVESYLIQLKGNIDRKLINKINDVIKNTYKTIKIEKKECKGVATVKPDQ
ncbi:hypothetical protein [Neptunomonas antarctica]|uniref:Uncharacterized protein n=1 Tax=Neptunomonas antarctica TaxID=619304 RepID=A0A1N7MJ24_9GAMM|nr:hypothetical protein [Neptunomonas antarctica]SIS86093.1 hypothetical protein SAMN05421760_106106 [Neptunomonas antarctica]